jgi:hypothetical protein
MRAIIFLLYTYGTEAAPAFCLRGNVVKGNKKNAGTYQRPEKTRETG